MYRRTARGFSLIELLIVMVIIAILVLIAIPAITSYRANARVAALESDLRNAATAVESSYLTTGAYPAVGAAVPGTRSAGVTLSVAVSAGDDLCIDGTHSGVTGQPFYYASYTSGAVERGVHAGTCGGGTGSTVSDGSVTIPTAPTFDQRMTALRGEMTRVANALEGMASNPSSPLYTNPGSDWGSGIHTLTFAQSTGTYVDAWRWSDGPTTINLASGTRVFGQVVTDSAGTRVVVYGDLLGYLDADDAAHQADRIALTRDAAMGSASGTFIPTSDPRLEAAGYSNSALYLVYYGVSAA